MHGAPAIWPQQLAPTGLTQEERENLSHHLRVRLVKACEQGIFSPLSVEQQPYRTEQMDATCIKHLAQAQHTGTIPCALLCPGLSCERGRAVEQKEERRTGRGRDGRGGALLFEQDMFDRFYSERQVALATMQRLL
ncbi:MAG: hypothetical protein SGPRY_004931 [Prymnesium sp.]